MSSGSACRTRHGLADRYTGAITRRAGAYLWSSGARRRRCHEMDSHTNNGTEPAQRRAVLSMVILSMVIKENSMSAHPPPVPPDQRPKAGPKDDGKTSVSEKSGTDSPDGNLAEQGSVSIR